MAAITARQLRSAAASVRGARAAGIETQAAAAAPALVAEAERVVARLERVADDGALAQTAAGMRAERQLIPLREALDELRAALAGEPA